MRKIYVIISLIAFTTGCKQRINTTSEVAGVLESSPRNYADPNQEWDIKTVGVNYWWADKENVFAITCYPSGESEKTGAYFSNIEDCKEKFSKSIRSTSIDDFRDKARKFLDEEEEFGISFKQRKLLEEYGNGSKDLASNPDLATSFAAAVKAEESRTVVSFSDIDLFLNDVLVHLRKGPESAIQDAKNPEVGTSYDKYMRLLLLQVTVGRYLPDEVKEKEIFGNCPTRETLPHRELPDYVTSGSFYSMRRDYSFLLIKAADQCSDYGFELAHYSDIYNQKNAANLIQNHVEFTTIPKKSDVSVPFGGGKLIKVRDSIRSKMTYAAIRENSSTKERGYYTSDVDLFDALPERYEATNQLCRREEIQFYKWNPCPKN